MKQSQILIQALLISCRNINQINNERGIFIPLFFVSLWLDFKCLDQLDLEHQSDLSGELFSRYLQCLFGGLKGFVWLMILVGYEDSLFILIDVE